MLDLATLKDLAAEAKKTRAFAKRDLATEAKKTRAFTADTDSHGIKKRLVLSRVVL